MLSFFDDFIVPFAPLGLMGLAGFGLGQILARPHILPWFRRSNTTLRLRYGRLKQSGDLPFVAEHRLPLLFIGQADQIAAALSSAKKPPLNRYTPMGWMGTKQEVEGLPWIGDVTELPEALKLLDRSGHYPAAILILDPNLRAAELGTKALGEIRRRGVSLLRPPRLQELSERETTGSSAAVRELSIEELLSRPPVRLDLEKINALLHGKRVLITGAGGSIGSELSRQIAALGCAHICLLDNSEFNLFEIDREISAAHPSLSRKAILCDVRDRERVEHWLMSERPDLVFHAAALKHVHLLEEFVREGVLTNVIGTWNVAQACSKAAVAQMILLSTDKAVAPSSIMGATKRLAEAVLRGCSGGKVRYSAVRFGNVLGSAGSVVPIFRSQIERGGPITVTHKDVERFFMTIPEAVHLVLHATAAGQDHPSSDTHIYVLEMGRPVRIWDLAHQMIALAGKIPGEDIEIIETGLRPGEKLTEELVDTNEIARPCAPGVIEVTDRHQTFVLSPAEVRDLEAVARKGDVSGLKLKIQGLMVERTLSPAQIETEA